jgi:RND family efflux transporter MFP subunit
MAAGSQRRAWFVGGILVAGVVLSGGPPQASLAQSAAARAEGAAAVVAHTVAVREVDDYKTVFATVRSRDRVEARVRIQGTIAELKVEEGASVKAGDVLALVADQKLTLKLQSLEAQIVGAGSRMQAAKTELDRAAELVRRGVTSQARYDQLKAAYDSAYNEHASAKAERAVVARQLEEGQVLAPGEGRVLRVPVTVGTVMMPGESVATIAANAYLLRIGLPERHARFLKVGDSVRVGARGLSESREVVGEGRIVRVLPELQGGQVIAEAEAKSLGDYFVGERALVWISAGRRKTIVVPRDLVFSRFGLDYVRLSREGKAPLDIVVQRGGEASTADGAEGVEILSGLNAGDKLVRP